MTTTSPFTIHNQFAPLSCREDVLKLAVKIIAIASLNVPET